MSAPRRMLPCELCQARTPRSRVPSGWTRATVTINGRVWEQWHKPGCPAGVTVPAEHEENP